MNGPPGGQPSLPAVGAEEQRLSAAAGRVAGDAWSVITRLAESDGSSDEFSTVALVQDIFRHFRALISDMKMAVDEQETPEEQFNMSHHLAHYQAEYDRAQEAFREAKLALQRNRELAYMRQRAELIGSLDYSARQRKFQSEQELLQGEEDVTAALRRTRQLMMANVEQQHGNLSVIDAGNVKLVDTRDELQGQRQIFKQSHGLLGTLKRQATMQWVWIFIALGVFSSAVVYVGVRRTPVAVKDSVMATLRSFSFSSGGSVADDGLWPGDEEAWESQWGQIPKDSAAQQQWEWQQQQQQQQQQVPEQPGAGFDPWEDAHGPGDEAWGAAARQPELAQTLDGAGGGAADPWERELPPVQASDKWQDSVDMPGTPPQTPPARATLEDLFAQLDTRRDAGEQPEPGPVPAPVPALAPAPRAAEAVPAPQPNEAVHGQLPPQPPRPAQAAEDSPGHMHGEVAAPAGWDSDSWPLAAQEDQPQQAEQPAAEQSPPVWEAGFLTEQLDMYPAAGLGASHEPVHAEQAAAVTGSESQQAPPSMQPEQQHQHQGQLQLQQPEELAAIAGHFELATDQADPVEPQGGAHEPPSAGGVEPARQDMGQRQHEQQHEHFQGFEQQAFEQHHGLQQSPQDHSEQEVLVQEPYGHTAQQQHEQQPVEQHQPVDTPPAEAEQPLHDQSLQWHELQPVEQQQPADAPPAEAEQRLHDQSLRQHEPQPVEQQQPADAPPAEAEQRLHDQSLQQHEPQPVEQQQPADAHPAEAEQPLHDQSMQWHEPQQVEQQQPGDAPPAEAEQLPQEATISVEPTPAFLDSAGALDFQQAPEGVVGEASPAEPPVGMHQEAQQQHQQPQQHQQNELHELHELALEPQAALAQSDIPQQWQHHVATQQPVELVPPPEPPQQAGLPAQVQYVPEPEQQPEGEQPPEQQAQQSLQQQPEGEQQEEQPACTGVPPAEPPPTVAMTTPLAPAPVPAGRTEALQGLKAHRQKIASGLLAALGVGRQQPGVMGSAAALGDDPLRVDPAAVPTRRLLWVEEDDPPGAVPLLPPQQQQQQQQQQHKASAWRLLPDLLPGAAAIEVGPFEDLPDDVKMSLLPGDEEFEGERIEALLAEHDSMTADSNSGGAADDEVQHKLGAMRDGAHWGSEEGDAYGTSNDGEDEEDDSLYADVFADDDLVNDEAFGAYGDLYGGEELELGFEPDFGHDEL